MQETPPQISEEAKHQQEILAKINAVLKSLGSSVKYGSAPEFLDAYKSLRDKKVLMVDDMADIIKAFIPDLIVATDGNMSFILHEDQTLEALVQEILAANPDIILLDYNLENKIKGHQVAKSLIEKGYKGKIFGFSTSSYNDEEFEELGLKNIIKNDAHPNKSVKALADLIK